MKKNKITNIILASIAVIIIGLIISYNYSLEQTKQKGAIFGNELKNIQEEVKQAQIEFNSKITQWEENELDKEDLLDFSEHHFQALERIISSYDSLNPPELFEASVELFRLSTETQLESDKEMIEWIKSNHNANKVRSDSLIQEAFEYEMLALGEFNSAKIGIKDYDTPGKFEAPDKEITKKVNEIFESKIENCQSAYDENKDNTELKTCLDDADEWKDSHSP